MAKTQLTQRQVAFIEAYLGEACANGTQAARIAGYSGTDRVLAITASRILKNDKVRAEIDQKQGRSRSRWKVRDMRTWWARMMEDESLDARDRIKASELLGKSLNAFATRPMRHEHAHVHVRALSDAELAAIAGGGRAELRVAEASVVDATLEDET